MTFAGPATLRRAHGLPAIPPRPNRGPEPWLAAVAVCYVLLQLVLTIPVNHTSLAWDESIYYSQIDPRSSATFFSAPRSRGVSLLGGPVAAFTSSPLAIRIYLAVVSGILLYAAFAVWRPLIGARTAALAALLFATLWVSVDYGAQLMPNIWVAFSAVAATGLFLRAVAERTGPRHLMGLALAVGWAAFVRAPDGVYLALPLLGAALLVRAWRCPAAAAAIAAGLGTGLAEWVIEAQLRFGDVAQRLADASVIEGGMGLTWNVGNALRAANGPLLCRPCLVGYPDTMDILWWPTVPVLVLTALVIAFRNGRGAPPVRTRPLATMVLPTVCALSLSVPYLFLINYSAPRFLLPAYALLALPVAGLIAHAVTVVRRHPTPWRVAAVVLAAVIFAEHLSFQEQIARRHAVNLGQENGAYRALAEALHRVGVRPPCLVAGNTEPVAYDAGCSSSVSSNLLTDSSMVPGPDALRAAEHETVAALVPPGGAPPPYAPHWARHELAGSRLVSGWSAYLPPSR